MQDESIWPDRRAKRAGNPKGGYLTGLTLHDFPFRTAIAFFGHAALA